MKEPLPFPDISLFLEFTDLGENCSSGTKGARCLFFYLSQFLKLLEFCFLNIKYFGQELVKVWFREKHWAIFQVLEPEKCPHYWLKLYLRSYSVSFLFLF